jgi:hypothetical protein
VIGGVSWLRLAGGDVYLLARVIHDWDDEQSSLILRNCCAAVARTSKLPLAERIIPETIEPGLNAQPPLLSDLNMLVWNGGVMPSMGNAVIGSVARAMSTGRPDRNSIVHAQPRSARSRLASL